LQEANAAFVVVARKTVPRHARVARP
jgi:hypothetical protein